MLQTLDQMVTLASMIAETWEKSGHPSPWGARATGQPWDGVLSKRCLDLLAGQTLPNDYGTDSMALFLVRWFQCGLPRFDIGHHAATAFALTDVSDVRWEDVRFPFDTTLIVLPTPSPIRMLGLLGEWVDVKRIAVQQLDRYSAKDTSEILAIITDLGRGIGDPNKLLEYKPRSLTGYDFMGYGEDGTQLFAYTSLRAGEETVHASLFGRLDIQEDDRRAMHAIVSIAVNVALWLTQEGIRPTARPASRRTDKRGRVTNDSGYRPVIYSVGETIKLGDFGKLRDHARAYFEQGGERGGWKVQARHSVRGHWRQQACGAGRLERRRLFVQPHWRGPEAGTALAKTYSIETP